MKINRKMGLSLLLLAGLEFTVAWGMEASVAPGTGDQITLVSAEGEKVTISRDVAKLSVIIENMLALQKEASPLEDISKPVPVSVGTNELQNIVRILDRVKNELTPRMIDRRYAPYKVQLIVNNVLRDESFKNIVAVMDAVNLLQFKDPFLINAVGRVLVYAYERQAQQIVNQELLITKEGSLIKAEEIAEGKEAFEILPPELLVYLKKHLKLKAAGVPKEWSIADLIEEQPEKIKLSAEKELDLYDLGLTSLDGFERIDAMIKAQVERLSLSNNVLTTIQSNAFRGLSSLKILSLSNNGLTTIQPDAFRGLSELEVLYLSSNELTTIQPDAFRGLSELEVLYLSSNELTTIQPDAFRGLSSLKILSLSNNGLTTIQPDAFQGLSKLEQLSLSNNELTTIQPNAFQGLSELEELNLSGNNLLVAQRLQIRRSLGGDILLIKF